MNRWMLTVSLGLCLHSADLTGSSCAAAQPLTGGEAQPAPGRDEFLERYAATYRFTLGQPRAITVTPDGKAVLFLRSGPRSFVQNLYELDVATGQERVLLTAEKILGGGEEDLTPEELARRERMRMASRGIASYQLSKDGSKVLVPLSGRLFVIERRTGIQKELESTRGYPIDPQFSPDGTKVGVVRDGEVYVIDIETGKERAMTSGATIANGGTISNGLAEFVAQEEMGRFHGYWWSPDSKQIHFQQTDTAGMEVFSIADPVNPEKGSQTWPYPRPGKKNAEVRLAIVNLDDRPERRPRRDVTGSLEPIGASTPELIKWDAEKYPYVANVEWSEEGTSPLILVQNREQTQQELLEVYDLDSGTARPLIGERDEAWLNIADSTPRWLKDRSGFLWLTESNGAWELQLRRPDGSVERSITGPRAGLGSVIHVDDKNRVVYVSMTDDPTQRHVWMCSLTGGPPIKVTTEPGFHSFAFGEESDVWVHAWTGASGDPKWEVQTRQTSAGDAGAVSSVKTVASISSVAESPGFMPKIELAVVSEHKLNAVIIRPNSFDASRKYPVLVSVYGGPGSQTVSSVARSYLLQQWMANHGFIVVSIDGRGTPGRGRAWERTIRLNLIDAPLDDQVEGLRALGAKYPEMDLSRVGIYGWSFGGYFSAMAAMRRPDVFHAGIAGAPVAAWEDYDTHYTERFMGLPEQNPEGYRASNVLTYCKDLTRPLLIIHGTADDNVYFMHSLKMTEALFRAGKDFEFLPLAGFTHMVPDPVVTTRLYSRMADFFERTVTKRLQDQE
ncbi:MAG: DPP IV N-terminal domain-containing protein [Phycisphaerales bacterium]|nr:DPP IV N-terminal domain-containing protein [Phycisphaerales bacterium]